MTLLNYSSSLIAVGREMKQFLRLAIPLASAQLTQSLTGFFDTLMMGRLGAATLAAGGLAALSFSALVFTAGGLVMAITPAIAQAYGAKDKNRIENLARQGLWLVLLLTIPLTGIISNLDAWMAVFGQNSCFLNLSSDYISTLTILPISKSLPWLLPC